MSNATVQYLPTIELQRQGTSQELANGVLRKHVAEVTMEKHCARSEVHIGRPLYFLLVKASRNRRYMATTALLVGKWPARTVHLQDRMGNIDESQPENCGGDLSIVLKI
eukprot:g12450.t1